MRSPGEQAVTDIDAALRELRRDEPAIDTVEKGLKAAKAVGVPVDLEGTKPPPSALAVTTTGFGPASVAPKKPVPPPKPVPAVSPLGKAAAEAAPRRAGRGRPARHGAGGGGRGRRRGRGRRAPLSADQLLQPPVRAEQPLLRSRIRPSRRSPARSRASPRTSGHTRRRRRRPRRPRTPRSPRPTTWPGRPRRPRSTRWTPSRRARSTRRRSSRRSRRPSRRSRRRR